MTCDLISLATPGIAGIQPYHPGKPVEELERELGISNIVKLASNENPLGHGNLVDVVLKNLPDFSRYPDGDGYVLKSLLAEHHCISPEQITLGNGSNDVLELIARAVVTSEHEVIFSDHAFAVYPLVVQAIGAKTVVIPATHWGHDLQAMQDAVSGSSRLIFIANPNNPTGTWSREKDLRKLLEHVPDNVIVVVDEAYFEYVQEDEYPNCISWLNEFNNLVITRTFSKTHGLAGLRIGYAVSHENLADLMNRVRQPFNVNSLALATAEAALNDTKHIERSVNINLSGMQQLVEAFGSLGLHYIPSVANFICVDLQLPAMEVYTKLLQAGVIVRPIEDYGMPNHLRITIGLEEENKKFIDALATILAD